MDRWIDGWVDGESICEMGVRLCHHKRGERQKIKDRITPHMNLYES